MTLLLTKNLYFRKKFIHYTFFYSVRPLYTTSQNIWGDGRMDRPPPQILGTVPQSPISLRPCLGARLRQHLMCVWDIGGAP